MSAYEQWELAAAAEEDRIEREMAEIVKYEESLREVCEEYALASLEDGTNWAELLEAYHDTTSPEDWPFLYDHIRLLAIREPGTPEYDYSKKELIGTLARAVDRGCLLDED